MAGVMLQEVRERSVLGFTLMVTQSFLYNAIFFTYGLVLVHFYGVPDDKIPYYFFPFAIGNLLGPLTDRAPVRHHGPAEDDRRHVHRVGVLLAVSGWLFKAGMLTPSPRRSSGAWCSSSPRPARPVAYLTVSEIFPIEMRAQAISFFFAIAQLFGGVVAPKVFGWLIGEGTIAPALLGYVVGGVIMLIGGLVAAWLGVDAERKSLEDVARPLSMVTPAKAAAAAGG